MPTCWYQVLLESQWSQVLISPESQFLDLNCWSPTLNLGVDPTLLLKCFKFYLPINSWVILIQALLCHGTSDDAKHKKWLFERGRTNWRILPCRICGRRGVRARSSRFSRLVNVPLSLWEGGSSPLWEEEGEGGGDVPLYLEEGETGVSLPSPPPSHYFLLRPKFCNLNEYVSSELTLLEQDPRDRMFPKASETPLIDSNDHW